MGETRKTTQRTTQVRKRKSKKAQARRKKLILLAAGSVVLCALAAFLITYFVVKNAVNKVPADIAWNNISVEGLDVSGMTEAEIRDLLEEEQTAYQAKAVLLKAEEASAEVLLSDLGFVISNVDEVAKQAVAYGKSGSVWSRHSQLKALEEQAFELKLEYKVDSELTKQVMEEQIPALENGAKDATVVRKNGKFVITDEEIGVTVDAEESIKVIEKFFTEDWNKIDGEVELVTKVEEPKLTRAMLEEMDSVLGTFTTYCGTGSGRVQNIITGAKLINGSLVMPGEIFSADMAMRPYTKENGFTEAGAYQNGKVIQSMGGGICQVSSTLYNAVILAELGVAQRQPHSMLVDYVKPSQDAAIAGDYKDMKLENTTDAPIYIEGYVSGGYITFTIYGKETRPANRSVKFVSETISTKDPGKKFEASEDALGTIVKTSSAHTGMEARLWKVVYENGKEVSREIFNTSSYMASPAYYTVGIKTDNAEAKAIVKAAIGTNDEAKINAAIAQAKQIIADANKPVEPEVPPVTPETPETPETPVTPESGEMNAPAAQAE